MEPLKIPIWKPPFRSFISCIVYRDFGIFSSKSDQGPFFVAISRLIQIKLLPCGAWSRQRPCSRSRTAPGRSFDLDHPEVGLDSDQPFFQTEAWSRSYLPGLIQINPMFRVEDWSRSKLGPGRWSHWISLVWKPPFRSFISCIVYRDFGTFSSKSDQGPFFVAISRLIQIKLLPCGAWSRQRPCSRSRIDPGRSFDLDHPEVGLDSDQSPFPDRGMI